MRTGYFSKYIHSEFYRTLLPVLGGVFIAGFAAAVMRISVVWLFLFAFGLVVLIPTLIVREPELYWLAIFLFTVPLRSISKHIGSSEYALALEDRFGTPAGVYPIPVLFLSDLPFMVLLLLWFLRIAAKKDKIYFPKSNIYALAFLGWSALSIIGSPLVSFGVFQLIQLFKYYSGFLYFTNNIHSRKELKVITASLLIGVLLQGMICVYQYSSQGIGSIFGDIFGKQEVSETMARSQAYTISEDGSEGKRAGGTIGPSNAQAQYFVLTLPLVLSLSLLASKKKSRLYAIIVFFIGSIGLVLTFSRGGIVAIAGAFSVVVLVSYYRRLISSKLFSMILYGCVVGTILLSPTIYNYMGTRPKAFSGRFDSYKIGWKMAKSNLFLGVGLNNSTALISEYDPEGIFISTRQAPPISIHNWYLVVIGEIGIIGLIFALLFFLGVTLEAYHATKFNDVYIASVAVGLLGGLTGIFIHIGIDVFRENTVLVIMWMYAGLAVALNKINLQEQIQ